MMTTASTSKLRLMAIVEAYLARERAVRTGDVTTAHLQNAALLAAMERRHAAQAARRFETRRRLAKT